MVYKNNNHIYLYYRFKSFVNNTQTHTQTLTHKIIQFDLQFSFKMWVIRIETGWFGRVNGDDEYNKLLIYKLLHHKISVRVNDCHNCINQQP